MEMGPTERENVQDETAVTNKPNTINPSHFFIITSKQKT
jgi:hypothetical protein